MSEASINPQGILCDLIAQAAEMRENRAVAYGQFANS